MSKSPNIEDDKINLAELFSALWAHKLLIILFTGLYIFLAVNYNLTAQKKFTAKAIFHIEENNSAPGFSLPKELGALASFAGLSAGGGGERARGGRHHEAAHGGRACEGALALARLAGSQQGAEARSGGQGDGDGDQAGCEGCRAGA